MIPARIIRSKRFSVSQLVHDTMLDTAIEFVTTQMNQQEKDVEFIEQPVGFKTFVESKDHMDFPPLSDRQYQLFDFMIGDDPQTAFSNSNSLAVLAYGKGSGKDAICVLMLCYICYLCLCMKSPQEYFKQPQGENIDCVNVAPSGAKANEVFFEKLRQRVLRWRWLRDKYPIRNSGAFISQIKPSPGEAFVTITKDGILFPKLIRVLSKNSDNESAEGLNILVYTMDEASAFQGSNKARNAAMIYRNLKSSSTTRFGMRGKGFILCLAKGTCVSTVDGRELPIEQLQDQEVWVYAYDVQRGLIVPAKATVSRRSGISCPVYKVTLDNGATIRCTGNHPFMLRDGSYVTADTLKAGASLMPLYRKHAMKDMPGYELIYSPAENKWHYAHRWFWNGLHPDNLWRQGYLIHHINFNKRDNRPSNIVLMDRVDHIKLHNQIPKSEDYLAKLSAGQLKSWANNPTRRLKASMSMRESWAEDKVGRLAAQRRGADKHVGMFLSADQRTKISQATRAAMATPAVKDNVKKAYENPDLLQRKSEMAKSWCASAEGKEIIKRNAIRSTMAREKRVCACGCGRSFDCLPSDTRRFFSKYCYYSTPEAHLQNKLKKHNKLNHKVVTITADGVDDVYDLHVPGYNNFALTAGVFVHNSYPREVDDFTMQMYRANLGNLHVYTDKAATWEVKPLHLFSGQWFDFVDGTVDVVVDGVTKRIPNVIKVPLEFKDEFDKDPTSAKMMFMADPPESEHGFIEYPEKITDCIDPKASPVVDTEDYVKDSKVCKRILSFKSATMSAHDHIITVDLGRASDKTALSMFHRELIGKAPIFVQDLITCWFPDKKNKYLVSFTDVMDFIKALNMRFSIAGVWFDQWQSALFQEGLQAASIPSFEYSLDKSDYKTFKEMLYTKRYRLLPFAPQITEMKQLIDLGHRVDHPNTATGSKDAVDTIVGATKIWLLKHKAHGEGDEWGEVETIEENLHMQDPFI